MEVSSTKSRSLHAAYLCIKDSVADDITNTEELKQALQYAGYNPTPSFLEEKLKGEDDKTVSYEEFCNIADELPPIVMDDISNLFLKVFGTSNGKVGVNDFKNMLLSGNHTFVLSDADLGYILEEANVVEDGMVDCNKLGKVILHTVNEMKQLSLQKLEEKTNYQRINSRTYTKKKRDKHLAKSSISSSLNVDDWNKSELKGCFYIEKQNVIAHQYSLEIPLPGRIVIKLKPQKHLVGLASSQTVDTLAYIFRESLEGNRNYVGFTDKKDVDGSFYWEDILKEGRYVIIPYSSGCRLKDRTSDPSPSISLVSNGDEIKLTKEFSSILEEIFNQVDLDNNGYLNRQEFNLYNWRTSGEEVEDDEWEVVQHNFDVKDGELTLSGFVGLHQLEAEDNGGDSQDLWVSLEAMGYNHSGEQDQASPFLISVYTDSCQPSLLVSGLKSGGLLLDKAVIRSIMENSDATNIKNMVDLIKYEHVTPHRACIVIQNKANSKVVIRIDCRQSKNAMSNRPSLDWTVEVSGKSAIVAHHLLPINEQEEWSVICTETLVK